MRHWWLIPVAVIGLLFVAWWMTHPGDLRAGRDVSGPTPVDQAVNVGIEAPAGRTLHISSVKVDWDGKPKGASADAYVCKGGALGFTPNPKPFCASVEKAKGATLNTDKDQLFIAIEASEAQTLKVDDIRVGFREGLQWGTRSMGPKIEVTVAE